MYNYFVNKSNNIGVFFLLFFQHALIDTISGYNVFTILKSGNYHRENYLFIIFLYNFLAFATQWVFGLYVDKSGKNKLIIVLSSVLSIVALLTINIGIFSIILVGFANSLFHVSAGSTVLKMFKGKAFYQGLFIAPGAVGLLLGILLSENYTVKIYLIFLNLLFLFLDLYKFNDISRKIVVKPLVQSSQSKNLITKIKLYLIINLLLVISFRSIVGSTINFPWKSNPTFFVYSNLLVIAIFFGKSLGGYMADKFGFLKIGFLSLLMATPLIYFGSTYAVVGITGILLFQMTTSITLTLIDKIIIKREGLSFGLTTLFLFLGSLPLYTNYSHIFENNTYTSIIILISCFLLSISIFIYKVFTRHNRNNIINL